MKGFVKDPDATLDYTIDWARWMDTSDFISSSTWIAESGITIVPASESFTNTTTTVFISGGSPGQTYKITNRITTNGNRIDERSFELRVRER